MHAGGKVEVRRSGNMAEVEVVGNGRIIKRVVFERRGDDVVAHVTSPSESYEVQLSPVNGLLILRAFFSPKAPKEIFGEAIQFALYL